MNYFIHTDDILDEERSDGGDFSQMLSSYKSMIEWNQKYGTYDIENREAIWIGIVAADENLECKKLFSKTITLEDIDSLTEETCKLVRIGRINIMNAIMQKIHFIKLPYFAFSLLYSRLREKLC